MTRTQIQMPDALYRQAKALADAREISFAELVRGGVEYMLHVSAAPRGRDEGWTLPEPVSLGSTDPFADPEWRSKLHSRRVAEERAAYRTPKKDARA